MSRHTGLLPTLSVVLPAWACLSFQEGSVACDLRSTVVVKNRECPLIPNIAQEKVF